MCVCVILFWVNVHGRFVLGCGVAELRLRKTLIRIIVIIQTWKVVIEHCRKRWKLLDELIAEILTSQTVPEIQELTPYLDS